MVWTQMKPGNLKKPVRRIDPKRGDVWFALLDEKPPAQGHEQAGPQPILILSANRFNKSAAGLVIGLTLTRTKSSLPWHLEIKSPEGGVDNLSYIMCESIRTIS